MKSVSEAEVNFLHGRPALLAGKRLVIADLHLGIERQMLAREETVSFTRELRERIERLVKETKAKRLLLLGDVKHAVPRMSEKEKMELTVFFEELGKKVDELEVVKGNHDGGIGFFAGKARVFEASGFCDEGIGFCHGQAWPDARLMIQDYLIIGHEHPAVEFVDAVGGRSVRKAWVVGGIDAEKAKKEYEEVNEGLKVVVMPAFNELVGGIAFNSKDFEGIGPLFKNNVFKLDDAKLFLLDGVNVGSVKKLRQQLFQY